MNKTWIHSMVGVVVGAAIASFGIAYASTTTPAPTTYYACLKGGTLSQVGTKSITCPKGSTKISWNSQGPAGPQGQPGLNGATGPQGAQGDQGPQGLMGAPGNPGPMGQKGDQGLPGQNGTNGSPYFLGVDGARYYIRSIKGNKASVSRDGDLFTVIGTNVISGSVGLKIPNRQAKEGYGAQINNLWPFFTSGDCSGKHYFIFGDPVGMSGGSGFPGPADAGLMFDFDGVLVYFDPVMSTFGDIRSVLVPAGGRNWITGETYSQATCMTYDLSSQAFAQMEYDAMNAQNQMGSTFDEFWQARLNSQNQPTLAVWVNDFPQLVDEQIHY